MVFIMAAEKELLQKSIQGMKIEIGIIEGNQSWNKARFENSMATLIDKTSMWQTLSEMEDNERNRISQ